MKSVVERTALAAALQWQMDAGADAALENAARSMIGSLDDRRPGTKEVKTEKAPLPPRLSTPPMIQSSVALRAEAEMIAAAADTLDDLRAAIIAFDGIELKKTATNMVFADGNPQAPVMLVGEAPGADEDRIGKPFVGVSGQLLDRIIKCIGLDRNESDPLQSVYISNILNWRPPGNRTPTPVEIEISLPFVRRHIALVKPKFLILCGGVSAKALLNSGDSISRLRGRWHDVTLSGGQSVHALCTYHPSYLLRTPSQKRAVWADMLAVQAKRKEMDIIPRPSQ